MAEKLSYNQFRSALKGLGLNFSAKWKEYSAGKSLEEIKASSEVSPKAPAKKAPVKKAPVKKTPTKKAPIKKAPVKKASAKKAPAKKAPTTKAPIKKAQVKKAPVKKAPAKKAPVKKESAKKASVKKESAKKASVKKASAKKAPAKKAMAKKAPAKKAPAKKALAKKAPVKKAPAKKAPVKKAPAKKAPVKKAPVKEAPAKKAPVKEAPATKAPVKEAKKAPVKEATKAPIKKTKKATETLVKEATKTSPKKWVKKTPPKKTPTKKVWVKKIKNPTFLDLVNANAQADPEFYLDDVYETLIDEDNYESQDNIIGVLPGAKLLVDSSEYNICYHGRECTVDSERVYSYNKYGKEYYITSEFDKEGDDLDVVSFTKGRGFTGGLMEWYKNYVNVHSKEDFNIHAFINPTNKMDVLIDIYHHFYPRGQGLIELTKYLKKDYDKRGEELWGKEPVYLRKKGEKATAIDADTGEVNVSNLQHGDVVYNSGGERSRDTKIVTQDLVSGQKHLVPIYDELDEFADVVVDISRYIEDPLDFYSKTTSDVLDHGVEKIVISPTYHPKVINKAPTKVKTTAKKDGFVTWHSVIEWEMYD